jgi:hypothetical protein
MAFSRANILTTREFVFGQKRIGQIISVPTGRLDKVGVYLEPETADLVAAESINVVVEAYEVDFLGFPVGAPLASDSKLLSEISVRGYVNFRLEANVPTTVAIVLRLVNGTGENHVAWRYESPSSSGFSLLTSLDDGSSWVADPTRTFAYRSFSLIANAIDSEEQTASILAGQTGSTVDNTETEFLLGETDRTVVVGDTVAINFGDFVVTLVVDQSGSMTWTDRDGLRFKFLKDFIDDLEISLPAGSSASYSVLKFKGRKIGKLSISIQGTEESGLHLDAVKVIRKTGSPPTGPSDGLEVFRGLSEQFTDRNLTTGTTYHYAAFATANLGGNDFFSDGRTDYAQPASPSRAPLGVAGLTAETVLTDGFGTTLPDGATDFGFRRIDIEWLNPAGFDYSTIILVRRDDRLPDSPNDGTVLLPSGTPSSTVSFTDTFGGTFSFIGGLTYFYRIFTTNAIGVKSLLANSSSASAEVKVPERPWEQAEPPANVPPIGFDVTPPLAPVITTAISNGELLLDWSPSDVDSKRYKLFFKEDRFPLPTNADRGEYDGEILFNGTETEFIHRFLQNAQPHFYVLVSLDKVGNASLPVEVKVDGLPPKPSSDATVFLPPPNVTRLSAEVVNSTTNLVSWKNPSGPSSPGSFFFGDTVRVTSSVEYLDEGTAGPFVTYEIVEGDRLIEAVEGETVDAASAIEVASAPFGGDANSIAAVVSVTPLIDVQNKMKSASVTLFAALRVRNRVTGDLIAEIKTEEITVAFKYPFSIEIKNEPQQNISRRAWKAPAKALGEASLPCTEMFYEPEILPGVYVLSGDPFFAQVEASFRDAPLTDPLNIVLKLLDSKTGNPAKAVEIPGANGQDSITLQTTNEVDEGLDRTGAPSGTSTERSLIRLTLPPGNIPGNFNLVADAEFNGYIRSASSEVHYEPILNVDLTLTSFQPDNVDITEQTAFVYLAPFDAPESQKVPVADFTVTDWSIKPLCTNGKIRPLFSEDNVQGVGVKAFTRSGIARNVFWGPGEEVEDEQLYEISVKVQSNGMTGVGFGMLVLAPPKVLSANRIFLRHPTGFTLDAIFSDGESVSTWEVIARPEEDGTLNDISSGQFFRNAILSNGGLVPSLEDGRIVGMTVAIGGTAEEINRADVLSNTIIKTNMTGPDGRARSAKARIQNGKAVFNISCNARVPPAKDTISEKEVQTNLFYGIQFDGPKSGLAIVLTVNTIVEINGSSVAFLGGGGDPVTSTPPTFIELTEPLRSA